MILHEFPGTGNDCTEIGRDYAIARRLVVPTDIRPGGYISGPTQFSLADAALWYLVFAGDRAGRADGAHVGAVDALPPPRRRRDAVGQGDARHRRTPQRRRAPSTCGSTTAPPSTPPSPRAPTPYPGSRPADSPLRADGTGLARERTVDVDRLDREAGAGDDAVRGRERAPRRCVPSSVSTTSPVSWRTTWYLAIRDGSGGGCQATVTLWPSADGAAVSPSGVGGPIGTMIGAAEPVGGTVSSVSSPDERPKNSSAPATASRQTTAAAVPSTMRRVLGPSSGSAASTGPGRRAAGHGDGVAVVVVALRARPARATAPAGGAAAAAGGAPPEGGDGGAGTTPSAAGSGDLTGRARRPGVHRRRAGQRQRRHRAGRARPGCAAARDRTRPPTAAGRPGPWPSCARAARPATRHVGAASPAAAARA